MYKERESAEWFNFGTVKLFRKQVFLNFFLKIHRRVDNYNAVD